MVCESVRDLKVLCCRYVCMCMYIHHSCLRTYIQLYVHKFQIILLYSTPPNLADESQILYIHTSKLTHSLTTVLAC